MSHTVDNQLQLAGDDADDLLVRMGVFRKRRTRIDLDPRMRDAIRMDQAGPQAWKNLTDGDLFELHEWHI